MTCSNPCQLDRLQQLLDESLPEPAERDLAEHIASCPDCQQQLETLAAGRHWWTEAGERLSRTTAYRRQSDDSGLAQDDDSSHFATDFAVDFLEPAEDPSLLGRLGDCEIVEIIGRGGMGVVLKGYQPDLHRHVAVKVLSPHLAASGAARRRFAREAQATAAVVHPHVMAIHSVYAGGRLPYLVMPLIPCQSLQERLDHHGPLDVKDILRIGMQTALGLAAAHAQGLVHRDVKPANILLEANVDRVLLTDFGLARAVDDASLTRTGVIAGTPLYMSPEQAAGDAVDHRSDLFSLGAVLYAMATGRPPFRAETTFGILRRIRETAPRSIREINPDIPEWLERVVFKLLEKDAGDRFDSAGDVATLLEQCLAHTQQPTTVPLPSEIANWPLPTDRELAPAPSRRPIGKARLAGALLALVVVSLPFWFSRSQPASAPNDSVDHEATGEAAPAATDVPLNWNATQSELDDTAQQIDQLEAAAAADLHSLSPTSAAPIDTQSKEER
ncbi:serine/threonine-protein kinase [Planctellipticum variicoloris]|uniref:serine/threonine-protein kinase n=1 Tax=Planctellipticum variicoloris TaxID=3064265 RepID=UPI0030133C9D|nr:serine/threonine protein kinase [Planctomycetaceae bacterium SH412]